MYEHIAITVAMVISIFNFVFTYSVAKVVLEHSQIVILLAKYVSLLTELYSGLNTTCERRPFGVENESD